MLRIEGFFWYLICALIVYVKGFYSDFQINFDQNGNITERMPQNLPDAPKITTKISLQKTDNSSHKATFKIDSDGKLAK